MKFFVQHRTRYIYTGSVRDSFNDARLCPISDDSQRCEGFALEVAPGNASVLRRLDFYLNQVHHFEVIERHDYLDVLAKSTVETFADRRDLNVRTEPQALLPLTRDEQFYDFLSASGRIALIPMIIHEAKEIVPVMNDVQASVEQVMAFVFEHFKYEPGSTVVEASVLDVWKSRSGVCQDFAHVMIAFCRALGVPARYVSGYFYVAPAAHHRPEDNNSQSHAWVECFLPGIGWVGYDPTHNRRVDPTYIKVAIGRDYADVRPLSGTFNGAVDAKLTVAVTIDRLD